MIDITFAAAFVKPIKVPAKFGAMSMWLTYKNNTEKFSFNLKKSYKLGIAFYSFSFSRKVQNVQFKIPLIFYEY